jgi:hypothetical protein
MNLILGWLQLAVLWGSVLSAGVKYVKLGSDLVEVASIVPRLTLKPQATDHRSGYSNSLTSPPQPTFPQWTQTSTAPGYSAPPPTPDYRSRPSCPIPALLTDPKMSN